MMTTTWRYDGVLIGDYVAPSVEYTLTDEHAASSYGQPVLLVSLDGEPAGVYGPGDVLPDTSGGLLGEGLVAARMVLADLGQRRVTGPLAEQFARWALCYR